MYFCIELVSSRDSFEVALRALLSHSSLWLSDAVGFVNDLRSGANVPTTPEALFRLGRRSLKIFWRLNRDGYRVDQYSSKSSNLHTVGMHEPVESDYFGAPAGT